METLDPQVVNLAKAIRQSETGGKFDATGDGGNSYGAYQFQKGTWDTAAQKYGVNADWKSATKEQQNEVAYKQIKEWKDQGKNVGQIASMWNAGAGEPDSYKGTFSNGQPSVKAGKFDVPKYAKSVADAYQKLKNGGTVGADPNNPSSTVNPDGSPKTEEYKNQYDNVGGGESDTPNPDSSAPGNVISDIGKGDYAGAIGSGIRNIGNFFTAGGSEQLGKYLGTKNAQNNAGDNAKYVDTTGGSTKDLLEGGAKTSAGIASLVAGGEALAPVEKQFVGFLSKTAPKLLSKVGGVPGLLKKYLIYKGARAIEDTLGGGAKTVYDHFTGN